MLEVRSILKEGKLAGLAFGLSFDALLLFLYGVQSDIELFFFVLDVVDDLAELNRFLLLAPGLLRDSNSLLFLF